MSGIRVLNRPATSNSIDSAQGRDKFCGRHCRCQRLAIRWWEKSAAELPPIESVGVQQIVCSGKPRRVDLRLLDHVGEIFLGSSAEGISQIEWMHKSRLERGREQRSYTHGGAT